MILGVVCARYHSVGLPGKAWRPMLGVPLIEYAVAKAYASQCDEVVTSHDIPRAVWSMAVPHVPRPEHLTGPQVAKWDVWRHLLAEHPDAHMLVDIDVTRPLTLAQDVDACIARLADGMSRGLEAVMAIAPATKHPAFDVIAQHPWGLEPFVKYDPAYVGRQQFPNAYWHGGIYAVTAEALRAYGDIWAPAWKGVTIPTERAYDVDSDLDWKVVELLMSERAQAVAVGDAV